MASGRSTWSSSTCIRSRRPRRGRTCPSTRSSRRSTSAGRAWCARRRRTSATCSSSSNQRTTPWCWRRSARPAASPLSMRFELARRAIAHTAAYDQMIATTLAQVTVDDATGQFTRGGEEALPAVWVPRLEKRRDLRYGENPHQRGAWYTDRRRRVRRAPWCIRARNCRSPTCWTSMRRRASRSSSTSRRPSSSSTRTRAASPRRRRRPKPMSARARPTRSRRSAASSA